MNIAFLATRIEKPSFRYRVLQYIPFLEKEGYKCEVNVIPKTVWARIKLFRRMKNFDIVFLQKKLFNAVEWSFLRKNARKLIYDFDDAVMFRESNNKNLFSDRRMNSFIRTVKDSDIVIAGNEYLKDLAIKENKKTFVIPTSVDMNRYTEKPLMASSDSVILGWIGSSSTLFYLERMKNVWDSLYKLFPNIKLKIVADKFFDCENMPVIKKQWSYEGEIQDLHTFDIGIMPLTDDPWSRGKCGFKLLQCMAVGIPVVCSPVGVNKDIVTDGINGFLADRDEEWIEKIGILIKNDKLRLQMGKMARETVLAHYSVNIAIRQLIEIFKLSERT